MAPYLTSIVTEGSICVNGLCWSSLRKQGTAFYIVANGSAITAALSLDDNY